MFKYSTRGLTAWPETVPRTGLRAGVGGARGAAAAWPRLQFLHSIPQGALLHIAVIKHFVICGTSKVVFLLQIPCYHALKKKYCSHFNVRPHTHCFFKWSFINLDM